MLTPKVTRINRIEIGYRADGQIGAATRRGRDVPEESLMLTGDENIVDIDFAVFWNDQGRGRPTCSTRATRTRPCKAVAESAMREVDRPDRDPASADRGARADRERRRAT